MSGPLLEAAILACLIARGRSQRAVSLPLLLIALMVPDAVVAAFPRANTWRFWIVKESIHTVLFLALGLEIAGRAFRRLPGAAQVARRMIAAVVGVTAILVAAGWAEFAVVSALPRALVGVAWLYTGTFLVMALFSIPVDPLHKAVLLGFAPYMMVYALTWGQVKSRAGLAVVNIVNPAMFLLALTVLLVAAWRREGEPPASREVVRFLWPWR